MLVRISAAVSALVLAGLLGLTIAATFGGREVIAPTGGVPFGPKDELPGGAAAAQALRERTELQGWRAVAGPAPGVPRDYALSGSSLPAGGPQAAPRQLVEDWTAHRRADWGVLEAPRHYEGWVTLPAARSRVLVQPEGRDWRRAQLEDVFYLGGWAIFGASLALALFLLARGRIPLEAGFSGTAVERFGALERANHWMTASSFIVMALTGLIILYGKYFIAPWSGAGVYQQIASASLYVHVALAIPFIVGVAAMAALWLRQNLPTKLDIAWLARFGGFLSSSPDKPPARRFNAGQKLVFWAVVVGGVLLFLSGVLLVFPFYWFDIQGMQVLLLLHATLAVLMIALMVGHIYIGTVGMEGAFDAMWSGRVDRNWAAEHHRLWLAELEGRSPEELGEDAIRQRQHRHSAAE